MFDGFMDLFDMMEGLSGSLFHNESDQAEPGAEAHPIDLDGDGIIDGIVTEQYLDTNGDGILDTVMTNVEMDTNGDGLIDSIQSELQMDTDGDGYVDSVQSELQMDTDGDGLVDSVQSELGMDTDGDGILDSFESMLSEDTDGNGTVDTVTVIESVDEDGDGTPDMNVIAIGRDTDHDGEIDLVEVGEDYNGDGILDTVTDFADLDGDGAFEPVDGSALDGCAPAYENFDPSRSNSDGVIGDPADAMDSWHWQETNSSCAVASQEFVLETLTGREFSEAELRELAEENGWYDPDGGTPMDDVGNILEYMGLNVNKSQGNSISDLEECLANGGEVIVGVDSSELWEGENDDFFGPGMGADHAVQVIGIDRSNPDEPMVILNDSGCANGCGAMVPLDDFMDAWEDSGCFMVEAYA